ncbi:hypothetical protein GYMLUDRAFT_66765 [Collybiopsis luxurians FD-317 M1]|nr:hypothetical protein GYMLUDRAFT_66765 [Collybiopsis luxurians FD-317 M1]
MLNIGDQNETFNVAVARLFLIDIVLLEFSVTLGPTMLNPAHPSPQAHLVAQIARESQRRVP